MKNPRLKREYAGCYTYTGKNDEFRISDAGYEKGQRHVWKVFTVPITTSQCLFWTNSLRYAVRLLDERDKT